MNQLNYASLEASHDLIKAGVVLETEHCWQWNDPCSPDDPVYGLYGSWSLVKRSIDHLDVECIPAPSMAEVWRELPKTIQMGFSEDGETTIYDDESGPDFISCNPADAMIDLLIWVRKDRA